jgi:anti-anti-sigma regulatory factor
VSLVLEENETQSVICVEGATCTADAARLKELLLLALQSQKEVSISLRRATYLDVAAVQLLWAAGREAEISGLNFSFAETFPAEIASGLADFGFEEFPVSGQGSRVK